MFKTRLIFLLIVISIPLYYKGGNADIQFSPPNIFGKAEIDLTEFYLYVYRPDFPIEVVTDIGRIDTMPISNLYSRRTFNLSVPHLIKGDTIWIIGTIKFDGSPDDLERIGVILGTRTDENTVTVRYPLSLLPRIDSLPSVKAILPSSFVRPMGISGSKIPIPPSKEISKSDLSTCILPENSFWIAVTDSLRIDLDAVKRGVVDACGESGAVFILVDDCIYNDIVISLDIRNGFNILHRRPDIPIFIFTGSASLADVNKVFENYIEHNPHLSGSLELRFMQ